MAANDELPRGWTAATRTGLGGQAILTMPASPGVTHVLTDVTVSVVSTISAAYDVVIEVLSAGIALFTLAGNNPLLDMAQPAIGADEFSVGNWSGKIIGVLGGSLVVQFNAGAGSNAVETITAGGYDI